MREAGRREQQGWPDQGCTVWSSLLGGLSPAAQNHSHKLILPGCLIFYAFLSIRTVSCRRDINRRRGVR